MSIFSKLFKLFVTVVLLPLVPMALLLGYYQQRQRISTLENHYNLAEMVSSELHRYVEDLNGQLNFIPSLYSALPDSQNTQQLLQQALQDNPDLRFLAVLSPQGEEIARALQGEETAVVLTAHDLLADSVHDRQVNAKITTVDGAVPSLEFIYPLTNGYILYGRQALTDLTDRLAQMRIGRTGQVYLASPDGKLYPGPYQWDPGVQTRDLAAHCQKKSRLITSVSSEDGPLVGAISAEPRLGMYIAVLQPKSEALRSLYLSNVVIGLFLLTIGVLAYFGAQTFARSLGEPIARLIRGAQEVSRGNLDYRVPTEVSWGEFQELIFSFNKMAADLKDYQALQLKSQVSEMKEQIFRAVAHDLRAPLMGLQGYLYILSSGQVSEKERKEYINRMTEAAQNLSSLLEDVLAVSRVEAGVALPQREWVELVPLVESVVRIQEPLAQEKSLALTYQVPDGLQIWSDPKLLRRMISNLLSNAVKFTRQGFVKITAGKTETEIWVSVQDSGPGLTQKQQKHIFDKFRQVDARAEGYGLGLFICRQLARAHGGDITVQTKEGEGSTFTIHLPKEDK